MDAGQPSEEELRAYMEQLRQADAAEIVAQAFSMLASAAQVKLGRRDARLVIDGLAGLVQAVEGAVEPQLASGMRGAVAQLQTAQVEAEREAVAPREQAATAGDSAAADAGAAGGDAQAQDSAAGDQRLTDRLWIPGRDQPPPR